MMKTGAFVWLALLGVAAAAGDGDQYNSWEEGHSDGKKSTNCSCGITNKERVVGGRETLRNEYPLMAAVLNLQTNKVFCGATIITEYHALTAAHCLVSYTKFEMELIVGAHDITKIPDEKFQTIRIVNAIEHDKYRLDSMVNDIALLVTATDIKFNKVVGPACLPTNETDLLGEYVKVIGWGYTQYEGKLSSTLQKANLKVVPMEECSKVDHYVDAKSKIQICAFLPNKDSCDGDSGGPLLWNDPETNRLVLIGIVSKGETCGKDPGVYTYVAPFLPWIQAKIAETREGVRTCAKEN